MSGALLCQNWSVSRTVRVLVGALLTVGLLTRYSCTMGMASDAIFFKQLVWLACGLAVGSLAASIDYHWLERKRVVQGVFGLALLILIAVLIPGLGTKTNGARRWLFGFQPSEFARIALLITLAQYCGSRLELMGRLKQGFLLPMAQILAFAVSTFLEPDWGTSILIVLVGMGVVAVAGTRWLFLLVAGVIGLEIFVIALCHDPDRLARVLVFLDPEKYKDSAGWQPWNALMALGEGGWTGAGLGEGRLKLGFIPEHHTDFILAVIGEELGLLGTGFVVLAFGALVVCGLRIAWQAREPFGQLLATGLTYSLGLQAFINFGVATSSLPNKGMPLPFISYGGSNLVAMLIGIGLLLNIARHGSRSSELCPPTRWPGMVPSRLSP